MTQLGHRDILLSRLERDFGICSTALNRFRPYLSCRKQYFLINDQKATETSLDLSVPQGLVRGLVPFSLYATRLTGLVENIVFVTMTILQLSHLGLRDICSDLVYSLSRSQDCVKDIGLWMEESKLKPNAAPTDNPSQQYRY